MTPPLAGLRVIDVGTRIGAPFCAGLLGEWGADVVKVEDPRGGDFMRTIGPFEDGYSLFWAVEGRGRRSVTCDLRQPLGQELFRKLAATADVVVENFRPGTMEHWHLGPADLDPRLVYVRISVFGQDGPWSKRPGARPARHRVRRAAAPHGLPGPPAGAPGRDRVGLPHRRVRGRGRTRCALRARRARATASARSSTRRCTARSCASSSGRSRRTTGSASSAAREGNRLANSAPLDNYLTADGRYVCIVAGIGRELRPAVPRDGPRGARSTTSGSAPSKSGRRTATSSTASSRTGAPGLPPPTSRRPAWRTTCPWARRTTRATSPPTRT